MGPEDAKYIQMSNLGSLPMILVNFPYIVLCAVYGWLFVLLKLCTLNALLFFTAFINRRGRHILVLFSFGTLLNTHLLFVTVAMGRETLLPLLIFFTAGGVVTPTRRGKAGFMIAALALERLRPAVPAGCRPGRSAAAHRGGEHLRARGRERADRKIRRDRRREQAAQ